MTPSARTINDRGTLMPSALAGLASGRSRGCAGYRLWLTGDPHRGRGPHEASAIGMERIFRTCWAAPNLVAATRNAGFTIRQRDAIPMFNPEYRENTYGRGLLAIMATFAVGRKGVSREEADAWLAEFAELDKQGKFFFSLNRYLFLADKPPTA